MTIILNKIKGGEFGIMYKVYYSSSNELLGQFSDISFMSKDAETDNLIHWSGRPEEDSTGCSIQGVNYQLEGKTDLPTSLTEGEVVRVEYTDDGSGILVNELNIDDLTSQMISVQELEIERELEDLLGGLEGVDDLDI